MAKKNNELSAIVQLSEGVNVALKSDLSMLSDYQGLKFREFFASLIADPKPKELIKEISSYPYVSKIAYNMRAYPVGDNRNYGGL